MRKIADEVGSAVNTIRCHLAGNVGAYATTTTTIRLVHMGM
ncbi:hypothetical protein [Halothiobacillus sp.]